MKTQSRLVLFSVALFGFCLCSPQATPQSSRVAAAAKPLQEGLPEIAVAKLRALLDENISPDEWRVGAEKLAEALIASGNPHQALELLDDRRLRDSEGGKFWRAQALARLQRFRDALPLYQAVASGPDASLRHKALFGTAEMLRALGRPDEALQQLSLLSHDQQWAERAQLRAAELWLDKGDNNQARRCLASSRPESVSERQLKRYLEARVEVVEQRPERALQILEPAIKHLEGAPPSLILATLFTIADINRQLKTPETADDYLEDFIDHYPNSPDVGRVFAKLDEIYRAERKPARTQLDRWTHEPEQPRRALAQWYLARLDLRAGRRERAYRLLGELRLSHPPGATIAPALVEFAQMQLEDGRTSEALAILGEARALWPDQNLLDRIDLMIAQAHYRAGQTEQATQGFERIGYSDSAFAKSSLFNAAVGRLKLNDKTQFATDYAQLARTAGDSVTSADLRLEQSLSEAARGDERATQSLRAFVRDFPNEPRVSEAWVALAELDFHRFPPALDETRKNLAQAREAHPTPAALERADYLSIWLEDSDQNADAKVIDSASRFVKQYPDSASLPEVRMKLAETYYRRQDFSNAQTHFEILAQKNAGSPLAEKALFFAGESAMGSMGQNSLERAVVLFNQVVELKGELRWAARNEQAAIERKLGKPQNALLLYDEVIKSDARPSDKREALCGKGDIYFELGGADPKNFQLAAAAYDQLAQEAPDAGHWRNQALFKKALCFEKTADRNGALSIFYDILEKQSRADRPPELFWFYKAGFDAARLLEDQEKWTSAAAIYKQLVAVAGPRSEEATARLNRLRLEHFLWEE